MDSRRIVYLRNISLEEASGKWLVALRERGLLEPLGGKSIRADACLGRVTAAPVFAQKSSPLFHAAAMDGYAVRFTDTVGASEAAPKRLSVGKEALLIDTGDPVPEGFNAVVMIEDVDQVSSSQIEITAPATPWQHVRTMGEDLVATELVVPENQRLRPVDTAAVIASGVLEVPVRRPPMVTIIPTGNELVEPGGQIAHGNIIEYNSRLLAGMAAEWGAIPVRHAIVPDSLQEIAAAVTEAVSVSDVVIVNAGSSAGSHDFTVHVIDKLGEVLAHGVRIKPGKPVVLGIVKETPVLGIPGYPVSAALDMELFAQPVICALQGQVAASRPRVRVKISRKIPSSLGSEEFVRVKIGRIGGRLVAAPIQRGAGALMSLARADGMLRIAAASEGVREEEEVDIELLKDLEDVENTIIVVGSHDICLDILGSELRRRFPGLSLSSAHVGSMGGLMALKRGEAHLAGIHLLDEETGEYNSSYLKRYLPGRNIALVNMSFREQGLMVAAGNPKKIRGVGDLCRDDIIFVNRQRGAGTRILLDYQLKQAGIEPALIAGYEREEFTHMAVAADVLDGVADAGMGILAAARALGLGFIPVTTERYDLAIPEAYMDLPRIKALLLVLRSGSFKDKVHSLGGYDTSHTGEILV